MNRFVRRTRAIAGKEVLHMIRDVRVIYLALGLPVVMLLLFGYAVSLDIDHLPLAVVDQDGTRESRRLAEALCAGGAFVRGPSPASAEEAEVLLRKGRVRAVLVVPEGYQRDLHRSFAPRSRSTGAQLLVDGSDGTTATLALGDAAGIVSALAAAEAGPVHATLSGGPAVRSRFNPALRSAYQIVPGVVAMILAMVASLLTALTVAREWERGSMEQLFATPVGRAEIILGKLIPYAGVGFVQALLVLTLGSYLFDVPIQGSLAMLFFGSGLFILAMLGAGLFFSSVTKSQVLAVQFSLLVSMLPAMLLSGFVYPIQNMPWVLQMVAAAVPARYYIDTLRGVLLKGNGLAQLLVPTLALTAFATLVVGLAVGRFRRRLG